MLPNLGIHWHLLHHQPICNCEKDPYCSRRNIRPHHTSGQNLLCIGIYIPSMFGIFPSMHVSTQACNPNQHYCSLRCRANSLLHSECGKDSDTLAPGEDETLTFDQMLWSCELMLLYFLISIFRPPHKRKLAQEAPVKWTAAHRVCCAESPFLAEKGPGDAFLPRQCTVVGALVPGSDRAAKNL